jgi:hypothetical protein
MVRRVLHEFDPKSIGIDYLVFTEAALVAMILQPRIISKRCPKILGLATLDIIR